MEKISYLKKYNTDTFNSWGIGQEMISNDISFEKVFEKAIKMKAHIIVKPSRGKYWYIKGTNNKKSFREIEAHLESNLKNNYKKKSNLWLINYI